MSKCSKCAADVPEDALFCGGCGQSMPTGATVPGEPMGVLRVESTIDEPGDGTPPAMPAEDTATLPVGTVVDRKYAIVRVLGRGGMGVIYLARDVHTDHEVVLKAVRRELAHRPDLRARMLAEGRALAHIDHPNVVRLNAVVAQGEDLWLVMQYIDGETLDKLVASHKAAGGMPIAAALGLFRQVASGVGAAHNEGVIHRDLKPANVIVRKKDGVAKVMDFGIAKLPNKPDGAITKGVIGSLWYMSPEQVKGRRDLDARVDVYALGILLYQMLVGRVPFNGASEYEIMKLQAEAPMPLARASRADVPAALDAIIQRACEKERDARFPGCDELLAALDAHVTSGVARAASADRSSFSPVAPDVRPPVPPAPPAPTAPDEPASVPSKYVEPPKAEAVSAARTDTPAPAKADVAEPPAAGAEPANPTLEPVDVEVLGPADESRVEGGTPITDEPAKDPSPLAADVAIAARRPQSSAALTISDASSSSRPPPLTPPPITPDPSSATVDAADPASDGNDVTTAGAVAPVVPPRGRSAVWIALPLALLLLGGGATAAVMSGAVANPFVQPPPLKTAAPLPSLAPPPVASSSAPPAKRPIEALAGSWTGNGRALEAVVDGDVLEFRVTDPAQFAPQDYAQGEARFALRATDEPNVFVVEDHIRPNPPSGKSFDARSRGTCQEVWTHANGEPLRARFDGARLSVDFAKIEPTQANFVVEGVKITSCVGLRDLKAGKVVSTLTRAE
jgi:serine/threonine protein kinase